MRLVVPIAIMVSLACSASAGTGDVNNDTKVTVADAVLALKFAGGLTKPTAAQHFAADIAPQAPDGAVNIADAVRIARISVGVEPKMPSSALPAAFSLTVSGNATRNITLGAGHLVTGKLVTSSSAVFPGTIAFADTTSGKVSGPWPLDESTGAFAAVLPTGTYQPIAITHFSTEPALGEFENTDIPVAVGSTLTVTAPVSGLIYKRGTVPGTSKLTVNYSGTLPPFGRTNTVYFTDVSAAAPTYGFRQVIRDIVNPPASVGMPSGSYYVESWSQYALSAGPFEDLMIAYYQPLTISGAKTTSLVYPKLYELNGTVSVPVDYPLMSVFGENLPTGTADSVAAVVNTGFESDYIIALVPGSSLLSFGLSGPFSDTWSTDINFRLPYTMPSAATTRNFTVPAVPPFRTITGVVKTPSGALAADVSITAWMDMDTVPAAGAFTFTGYATTNASGAFTLTLPDGVYTVTANP